MDGVNGYRSWRWIFILEGILTSVVAVIGHFFMQGFPEEATFLLEDDKQYILTRLKQDAGGATSDTFTLKMVLSVFRDWQIWCMFFILHTLLTQKLSNPPRDRYWRLFLSFFHPHDSPRLRLHSGKSTALFYPSGGLRNHLVIILRISSRPV